MIQSHLIQLAETPTATWTVSEPCGHTRSGSAAYMIRYPQNMQAAPTASADSGDEDEEDALLRMLRHKGAPMPNPHELHFNPLPGFPDNGDSADNNDDEDDDDNDDDEKAMEDIMDSCYSGRINNIINTYRKCIPELHTPITTPHEVFFKEHNFEYLLKLDYYLLLAIIRHYFGDDIYHAFCDRRIFHATYHSVTDLINDMLSDQRCRITPEMHAMAEQARKDEKQRREERLTQINPCNKGAFRLCGRHALEDFFNENIIDIVNNFAVYRRLGINFPRAFILEGVPGCGKTYAVERLAEHLNWQTYHITSSSIGTSLIHETSKNIEQTFETAAANAPSLVIIDEVDAFVPDRSVNNKDFVCEEVASFLKCLQNAAENHVLVIGMTNRMSAIDPAVLRTGRLGTHLNVGMPDRAEVLELLEFHLAKRPHAELNLADYADRLTHGALSDVTYVVEEAAMCAARRRAEQIESCDIESAFNRLQSHCKATAAPRRDIGFHAE